jgi:hypothetical protein
VGRQAGSGYCPECQIALEPGARLAAEFRRIGRSCRGEPGLDQDLPGHDVLVGRDVLVGGGRPQCVQPVPRRRQAAQLQDGRGRQAATGHVPRDPVAEHGAAVLEVVQMEPAQNRAVLGDEHVEHADAGLLLGQQGLEPVGEPVEVGVAAVRDQAAK